jgi:hypothetical protein
MLDCRYCGRYTRLRPCCTSVECTKRNEEYDRHATREAQERADRRKGGARGISRIKNVRFPPVADTRPR